MIDSIYEAAVSLDRWPHILTRISSHAGARGGLLFTSDQDGVRWQASPSTATLYAEFVRQGWPARNNRIDRLIGYHHPGFMTDSDLCTAEEIATMAIYTEFLTPLGFSAGAATAIPGLGEGDLILTIEGFSSHAASRAAVSMLDGLRPHLARASMLAARFRLERARAAVAALELIGVPACVVGTGRRLLVANEMFNARISELGYDTPGGLALWEPRADVKLRLVLGKLCTGNGQGASLPLTLRHSMSKAVLHVVPMRGTARDLFAGATAILTLAEPGARAVPTTSVIQELLDLTPAEARLSRHLVAGGSLAAFAAEAGISPATARTQLRNIFDKTGMSRQGDLVAYLSNTAHPAA